MPSDRQTMREFNGPICTECGEPLTHLNRDDDICLDCAEVPSRHPVKSYKEREDAKVSASNGAKGDRV